MLKKTLPSAALVLGRGASKDNIQAMSWALQEMARSEKGDVLAIPAPKTSSPELFAKAVDDRPKIYMGRAAIEATPIGILRVIEQSFGEIVPVDDDLNGELPSVGKPREIGNIDDAVLFPRESSQIDEWPLTMGRHRASRTDPKNLTKHKKAKRRQQKQGRKRNR